MKRSNIVVWLSLLIAVLALVATGAGLFWPGGSGPFDFTTLRGQTARIYGQGLYRYDTLFMAAGNRGVDLVVLVLGIPLLLVSAWLYRRGSLRGSLLLVGTLGYFLYVYASVAFGAAYNQLFLVYVALFSACTFAFVQAFSSIDRQNLAARFSPGVPRRSLAVFMFVGGVVTLFVWGLPLVAALAARQPPDLLDSYTTMVTYALDLAIITPSTFLAGALVLRREPLGYVIALPLLVLIALLLPQIGAQTAMQLSAGVALTPGQIVGPIAGFAVLGLPGAWLLIALLRNISDEETGSAET